MEYDTNPGVEVGDKQSKRYQINEEFHSGGQRYRCWADAAARIRMGGDSVWELLAYVEYDRSTMTEDEIANKMPGYYYLLNSKAYRKHWSDLGREKVFVLFICPSEERARNIAEAIRSSPAAKYCRIAVESDLQRDDLLTASIWRTADGEMRSLLKALPSS